MLIFDALVGFFKATLRHFGRVLDYNFSNICPLCNLEEKVNCPNFIICESGGITVGVRIVFGRLFMTLSASCPFKKSTKCLQKGTSVGILISEIHLEAPSETIAGGWHAAGRAGLVVGSHTHVQTADKSTFHNGRADITDLVRRRAHKFVIGRDVPSVLERFVSGIRCKLFITDEDLRLSGCMADFNRVTKCATKIAKFVHLA
jgi:calcineurin-like phosphoesterase